MGRQIWITDEAVARVLFVKGRSGVDPDCLVAYLEADDSNPLWIVDCGRGGKVSGAYICGLGIDSKVRARRIDLTIDGGEFTEAQIDAACAAWDRVWMGCAYQDMARDAVRAALEAAEQVRQTEVAVA